MVIEDRWEYEDSIWTGSIAGSNTDCTLHIAQSVPLKNMTDSVKVCVYMRR